MELLPPAVEGVTCLQALPLLIAQLAVAYTLTPEKNEFENLTLRPSFIIRCITVEQFVTWLLYQETGSPVITHYSLVCV
jgi:hypothetical protein